MFCRNPNCNVVVNLPCHMFIGASVGNVRWSSLSSMKNADAAWR